MWKLPIIQFFYRIVRRIRGGRCTALVGPPVSSVNSIQLLTAMNRRSRVLANGPQAKVHSTWSPMPMSAMPCPPILPYLMSSIQLVHCSPFIQHRRCKSQISEQIAPIHPPAIQPKATLGSIRHGVLSHSLWNRNKIFQRKLLQHFRYQAANSMRMTTKIC